MFVNSSMTGVPHAELPPDIKLSKGFSTSVKGDRTISFTAKSVLIFWAAAT